MWLGPTLVRLKPNANQAYEARKGTKMNTNRRARRTLLAVGAAYEIMMGLSNL